MRMIVKPMPGYSSHHHGRVSFLAEGREVIVDEQAKPLHVQFAPAPQGAEPRVYNHHEPLRVSPEDYAGLKAKFGTQLVCEPIGVSDLGSAAEKIAALEAELADLRAQLSKKK